MDHPIERPTMDNTKIKLTDKDLNEILRSFDDDPNNELRTYTDSPYITLDSLVTLLSKKTDQFSILNLNIQSLNSKFDAFTALHFFHISSKNVYASVPSVYRKPGFLITMIQLSLIYQAIISFTLENQAVNVEA